VIENQFLARIYLTLKFHCWERIIDVGKLVIAELNTWNWMLGNRMFVGLIVGGLLLEIEYLWNRLFSSAGGAAP